MLKRDRIPIVLNLQSRMAEKNNNKNEILEEMRKLNDNFSKFQSDLAVTKHLNTELTKQIASMDCQCWANSRYSRKESLEIVGIPCQVDDNQLETKVLSILKKISCIIDPGFIDDDHRLGKNNDKVIVKFTRRKDCKQALQVKKDLKDLNPDDLALLRVPKFF